ncbi:MAG: WYL domain-containing protein [Flavobacterium sp.]|nr:MAG: WYL domain-containing protein [Flavobacterium sp.]
MSKRAYISRYLLILKKLKTKKYCSFAELQSYITNRLDYLQMQDDSLNIGFSRRTLQRDIREINNIFGMDIEYSKSQKGYFISSTQAENMNFERMIEAFDMFNSLKTVEDLSPFIHFEKRKPQGTESFAPALEAIQKQKIIRFQYFKFEEEEARERKVKPLLLKEFRSRWYIVAQEIGESKIKTFGLDRISELEITQERFDKSADFDAEAVFSNCFGIINQPNAHPENIILSFTKFQGNYIKTFPLHETQQILLDNDSETRIKLRLHITHDFLMEMLSFGENVEVISPFSLQQELYNIHQKCLRKYDVFSAANVQKYKRENILKILNRLFYSTLQISDYGSEPFRLNANRFKQLIVSAQNNRLIFKEVPFENVNIDLNNLPNAGIKLLTRINEIKANRLEAAENNDFELAIKLRDQEKPLMQKLFTEYYGHGFKYFTSPVFQPNVIRFSYTGHPLDYILYKAIQRQTQTQEY